MEFAMKKIMVFAAVLLCLFVGGGPVAAAPPEPADTTFFNNDCGFRIKITVTGGGGVNELPGGAIILTAPNQRVTLTIVKTGESVSFVITGATHIDTSDPGLLVVTSTGNNVLTVPEGPTEGVYFTQGTVTFVLDDKGRQVKAFEGPGKVTDICTLLA
jgi:hypothetical protein